MIVAHIGGVPLEETLATTGPAFLTALGVLAAQLRARMRNRAGLAGPAPGSAERAKGDVQA